MTIGDYFGKLQPLWDELATYDPIPSCLCGFCLCDLGEKFQLKQDNDRLHEFLCGIHVERFGALRSSLLSQDPPPTLDRAYHAMLQEEQLQSKRDVPLIVRPLWLWRLKPLLVVRLIRAPKVIFSVPFVIVRGMIVVRVLRKMVTPSGGGDRQRGSCHGGGPRATGSHHPGTQGRPVQPGRALVVSSAGSHASGFNAGGSLSDMEWQKLKIMLSTSEVGVEDRLTGKPLTSNWIIDTGASSHVTCNLSILFDIVDYLRVQLLLPMGEFPMLLSMDVFN
ncbi:hypothetical protein LIER_24560 [Lithospermum erythrorhizon]|uniref:Uncharacterized protein n=1 Tax=Lithospermum erythrorhizon TaxID=34254 RepID=A0AAV3R1S5_LITER